MLGITWGLGPTHLFSYQPDEYFSLQAALNLLNGDPNPHFFNYPSLYLYLAAIPCLLHFGLGGIRPELPDILRAFTVDARLTTVLLALVTVGAAYGTATRLADRRAGLLAAAIVAFAPGHVLYSHFAAVDVPLACFMTLAAWAGVVLLNDQRWKIVVLAGLACGAAAATKYNGALMLVALLIALAVWLWRSPKPRPWRAALLRAAAIVLIAAAAFAVLSPYVFLDWQKASHDIAFEMRHMREGEYPAKAADPCGWHFQARALAYAVGGPIGLLLLLVLFAVGSRTVWPRSLLIIVVTLAWYLLIGATGVRYGRYALPLVPLLAVGAGTALGPASRLRPFLCAAAVLSALGALTASVLLSGSVAFTPEPRDTALQAILGAARPDERIGLMRTVWFDMPPLDFNNGGDALGRMYKGFRRPVRRLVVFGVPEEIKFPHLRPEWLIETDFQMADGLRARDRLACEWQSALERWYVLHSVHRRRAAWPVSARWGPVPHDFSYPFTTIRIWHLKSPEDTAPQRANHAP